MSSTATDLLLQVLKTYKRPPMDYSDSTKALAILRAYVNRVSEAEPQDADVDEETVHAPAKDGYMLPLHVFRAKTTAAGTNPDSPASPLIVLYFGGGFVFGHPRSLARAAIPLVKKFNAVVVAPSYRLAPEHPLPAGVNDGWDAFAWIADNATGTLRADPSKGFIIGGVSAGGTIANVVAHLAYDRGVQPALTGAWLCCSGVRLAPDRADQLPEKYRERLLSRTQDECVNSITSTPELTKLMYEARQADPNSELYAPLIWPSEAGHKGFPKTYLQVCGMDTARDEALIFDDMLKSQGTPTRLKLYEGLPHVFFHGFKDLPQSKGWHDETMNGFSWLLGVQNA
jgi:acetyl esterase/lipase